MFFKRLEQRIMSRIDSLGSSMDIYFGAVNRRIDQVLSDAGTIRGSVMLVGADKKGRTAVVSRYYEILPRVSDVAEVHMTADVPIEPGAVVFTTNGGILELVLVGVNDQFVTNIDGANFAITRDEILPGIRVRVKVRR